jgi:hypothetical protein
MKPTLSLQEAMNEMVRRLGADQSGRDGAARKEAAAEKRVRPLNEAEAYAGLEPVMGQLYKQYLDAQAAHQKVVDKHGPDSPMTIVAGDMTDSARSAVETRLIELKENRALAALAAIRMQEDFEESWRRKRKEQKAIDAFYEDERRRLADRARKAGEDGYFMALMLMMLLNASLQAARRNLSIAAAFSTATRAERRAAA